MCVFDCVRLICMSKYMSTCLCINCVCLIVCLDVYIFSVTNFFVVLCVEKCDFK
jgi:hypothetical protein